jgi:cyclopropane fatty-acyl-phospholipid synthase-like methyltransferase
MNRFSINTNGFWETGDGIGHVHDNTLCSGIINYFKEKNVKKVFDFGCGLGDYAKSFIANDFDVKAFDGNPNTEKLTNGIGKVLDFSQEFNLGETADCSMSLEVGEHIPKEFEQTFFDNICRHTNSKVLLSWAVIGQDGDGHVNCQNNDYVISEMDRRGFKYDENSSNRLRSVSSAPWFRNTIMVFEK